MSTKVHTFLLFLSTELQTAFGSFNNVDYQAVEKDLLKKMEDNQSFWPGETYPHIVDDNLLLIKSKFLS